MFRKQTAFAGVLALIGAFAAHPAFAGVNLLSNTSFEDPVVTGDYQQYVSDDTIGQWIVSGRGVKLVRDYWNSEDGNQSIDLDGNIGGPGIIFQRVNTTVGQRYQLTFWSAGDPGGGGDPLRQATVMISGDPIAHSVFDTTGHTLSNMGWKKYTYDFFAVGDVTAVAFVGENKIYGTGIDNVSLEAVPEASTVALFGLMAVGGVFLLRRKSVKTVSA